MEARIGHPGELVRLLLESLVVQMATTGCLLGPLARDDVVAAFLEHLDVDVLR